MPAGELKGPVGESKYTGDEVQSDSRHGELAKIAIFWRKGMLPMDSPRLEVSTRIDTQGLA